MKKKYENPTVDLTPLDTGDVIRTSGGKRKKYLGDWDTELDFD